MLMTTIAINFTYTQALIALQSFDAENHYNTIYDYCDGHIFMNAGTHYLHDTHAVIYLYVTTLEAVVFLKTTTIKILMIMVMMVGRPLDISFDLGAVWV